MPFCNNARTRFPSMPVSGSAFAPKKPVVHQHGISTSRDGGLNAVQIGGTGRSEVADRRGIGLLPAGH